MNNLMLKRNAAIKIQNYPPDLDKLKGDAFWHFLFGKHPRDKERKVCRFNF